MNLFKLNGLMKKSKKYNSFLEDTNTFGYPLPTTPAAKRFFPPKIFINFWIGVLVKDID